MCDAGLAISLAASAVMNGICCLHNLSVEEEKHRKHREELRRTIGIEYERQRLFDRECEQRRKQRGPQSSPQENYYYDQQHRSIMEQVEEEKSRLFADRRDQQSRTSGGSTVSSYCSRDSSLFSQQEDWEDPEFDDDDDDDEEEEEEGVNFNSGAYPYSNRYNNKQVPCQRRMLMETKLRLMPSIKTRDAKATTTAKLMERVDGTYRNCDDYRDDEQQPTLKSLVNHRRNGRGIYGNEGMFVGNGG